MRFAGLLAVVTAIVVCLRAMQRQTGWLFWASMPNAIVLAWTLVPYVLALVLLQGTYRTGQRQAAVAATAVAAGLLALTLLFYAGPLVDKAGLMSGPAFIMLPAWVLILCIPALAVVRWRAGRSRDDSPPAA